ncbi:hypothetical protein KY290_020601 [Solanum tuberosum]|uniref:ATP-dependent DNA helicase n=1 Tax=Solanum tuberosum TaxID=4113 RepID=A0ABQ7V047_SOLTU|nr:hypothetical protein KY290_020601 [Solanum tuberosum]
MTDQKKLARKQRFSLRQNKKRGKYSSDVNDLQSTSSTAFPVSKGKEILVDEHIYSYPISMPQSFSRDNRISNHLTHDENEDVDMLAADEFGSRKLYNEGDPIYECQYCGAYFWYAERIDKKCKKKRPVFTLCCGHGKIKLPNPKDPPTVLKELLFGSGEKSNHFRENIRTYNSMFSFTSMGGKIDASVNQTKGPRTFRLSGQNYHKIGSLLPNEGSTPKFAQLYIYDTENEVTNRMNVISSGESNNQIHAQIVTELKEMLDKHNVLAKSFRMVRDRFQAEHSTNVKLRLIGRRGSDGRRYNLPSVSEVAALVVGDFEPTNTDRDIIIESQNGQLQRINELNAAYLGLQEAVLHGDTEPSSQGQRIILSSTFTGGTRYMLQNYQDAMAICKWAGYPDLFITFTCNPKWPKIKRFVHSRGLHPEDRPDIITRVFKIKLDHLIKDLRDNKVFGEVKAVIYTIEFQKRGLPHAHILLFLHDKFPNVGDIDAIISAELPDKLLDPDYYVAVTNFMMHGPCGSIRKSSPCMQKGKCTKHFPKRFLPSTSLDEEGYPLYRRRDDGRSTQRSDSKVVDEIKMYCDCRYISSCEAAWRIFKFPIHHREPSVERLSFHLPDNQNVIFSDDDPIDVVINKPTVKESMFLRWLEANKEFPEARHLTYAEFPLKFVWKQQSKRWEKRKTSAFSIGRIFFVPPGSGEQYYLRLLLNVVKGPTSYEEIRRINDIYHETFRDACYALGLLDDDKEYVDAIVEAKADLKNRCLQKIETFLKGCGRSFQDFSTMPLPVYNEDEVDYSNRLIRDEMRYNKDFITNCNDPEYLQQRAILAPTLDMVESINQSDHTYSALEHVGVPVMLLRNIDQSAGLCNGTRLIVTKLGNQVIEAKVLSGQMVGRKSDK